MKYTYSHICPTIHTIDARNQSSLRINRGFRAGIVIVVERSRHCVVVEEAHLCVRKVIKVRKQVAEFAIRSGSATPVRLVGAGMYGRIDGDYVGLGV